MLEKDFQKKFSKWISSDKHFIKNSYVYELKSVEDTFYITQWVKKSPHQLRGLLSAKDGIGFKLSDADPRIKPFDGFFVRGDAYLIILFNTRKIVKFFTPESIMHKTKVTADDESVYTIDYIGELLS